MKTQLLTTSLCGALLGASITYGWMYFSAPPPEDVEVVRVQEMPTSEDALEADGIDPFSKEQAAKADENPEADPFAHISSQGYTKLDMSNPISRDIAISFWYGDMGTAIRNLEIHTGHVFQKRAGKMYASPVEILEEQLQFMRDFLAETERIDPTPVRPAGDSE